MYFGNIKIIVNPKFSTVYINLIFTVHFFSLNIIQNDMGQMQYLNIILKS